MNKKREQIVAAAMTLRAGLSIRAGRRKLPAMKDATNRPLVEAARAVRENAHAPYSRFKVGAAIRTASGAVHVGCNVENIAYPEGTCAEAGAIAAMVAAGEREIAAVAVIADGAEPITPCGGCRQKLAEFAAPDVPVTMATTRGRAITMTVAELLPGAFGRDQME